MTIKIRQATTKDAAAIQAIYAPYVAETAVTFEIATPDVNEMRKRIISKGSVYPYLVAEDETGEIFGFTYAGPFRPRSAYLHSVESSIYIRQDYKGHGLGRRLYNALDKILVLQNIYNVYACVAYIEPADEYVPAASKLFHEKLGFKVVATFTNCGRKFHHWYDLLCMEKFLMEHTEDPDPFVPLPEVDQAKIQEILKQA